MALSQSAERLRQRVRPLKKGKVESMSKITTVPGRKRVRIGIDGPAGAGKSTLARRLAGELGLPYIDTGAMYRALALGVLRSGLDPRDTGIVANLASTTKVTLKAPDSGGTGASQVVLLDGRDVTAEIRSPEVNAAVSYVAENPAVRRLMVAAQREMAAGGAVMEGRDICTRVLPDAELKVFLTASFAERARRRYREILSNGYATTLDEVAAAMATRDRIDSGRETDPLRPAEDSIVIDSTCMNADEVTRAVLRLCEGLGSCCTGC